MSKSGKLATFVAGAAIGAGLGVLFAPKKGSETRAELKDLLNDLTEKTKNIKAEDVKKYIEDKIDDIKTAINDLDKETVLRFAKEKAKSINEKTEELVKYVIAKGTPVMKDAVDSLRTKTADVTRDILSRLEKKED